MAQTARTPSAPAAQGRPASRFSLNSDGKAHPLENTLALVVAVLGAVAFATCWVYQLHVFTAWVGLAGMITAVWAQYISATTAERFVIVIFGGASAVGFGIALAHGGLV
ncbi:hypothetical protein [Phaeacidiphilus oryzae]|jgi:hypothetical protein|uniref:hypothetical protein n=1 Tax=Phaeacidiphilus oryzae TaxID=348818 RepID=UPI000562B42C|nr:hypothetical protein [Phaeacidiphilus oryzae]